MKKYKKLSTNTKTRKELIAEIQKLENRLSIKIKRDTQEYERINLENRRLFNAFELDYLPQDRIRRDLATSFIPMIEEMIEIVVAPRKELEAWEYIAKLDIYVKKNPYQSPLIEMFSPKQNNRKE